MQRRIFDIPVTHYILITFSVVMGMLPPFPNPAAVLLLILAIPLFSWNRVKSHWLFLTLLGQYFIIQLGLNLYHDGSFSTARLNDTYLLLIVGSVLFLSIALKVAQDPRIWHTALLIGIWFSAGYIGLEYVEIRTCRATALASNPLQLAFSWVLIAPFVFSQWAIFSNTRKHFTIVTFGLIGLTIFCFTGSRMATLAWLFACPAILYFIWLQDRSFKWMFTFCGVMLLSICLAVVIEVTKGCSNIARFGVTFDSISFLSENLGNLGQYLGTSTTEIIEDGMHASDGTRFVLWAAAFDAIQAQPVFGYGQVLEKEIINVTAQSGLPHSHNQFLSWGIWGGYVGLISGCIFGFSSILTRRGFGYLTVLSVLLAGAVLMTDSLLTWSRVMHACVPIMIFGYALNAVQTDVDR